MSAALLAPPSQQPDLLTLPAARDFCERLEAEGEYTGERLAAQRPELYAKILVLLAQGHGSQYIADRVRQSGERCSKNTVRAVRAREGETIDILKDRIAAGNFQFAADADEAAKLIVTEIMSDPKRRRELTMRDVQSLKVSSGIAVQNGQLLSGKPTVNIGLDVFVHPSTDLNAELAAHIAGLKSAGTHLAGEKAAQKDGALGQPAIDVSSDHVADEQSPALPA